MIDRVNNPSHYTYGEIECIDYIRDVLGLQGFISYCRGNIIKYCHRVNDKDNPAEDMRKIAVYATWAAEALDELKEVSQD